LDRAIAIFVFFIIIVVGTILVAPSYIDWNRYRGAIEAYAHDITGRDVSIDGDIGFALLPVPELTLSKFSIANDASENARKMISLDRLELRAALKPLLSARVELTDVHLIRPLIAVEVLAGNETNWRFDPAQGKAPPPTMQVPWWLSALLSAIRLDHMTVEDGTLTYSDAELQVSNEVRDLNGVFTAATLDGPFTAKGRANFRGVDILFDSSVGDTAQVRATPASLTLTFVTSQAKLKFRGVLEKASLFGPIAGRLSFKTTDGGAGWTDLMSLMRGESVPKPKGRLAKILGQDLNIEADLKIADRKLTADDLILGLGGVRAKGQITATLGRESHFTAKLSARSVNLDSLLLEAAKKTKSVNMSKAAPTIEKELTGFILPDSLTGTINLKVDGVIYRAGVIQNLSVEALAEKGHIKVKRATGRLPGKTAFVGKGAWRPVPGGTRFDGKVTFNSENPRALLTWAGLAVDQVPANHLNTLNITGQLNLAPSQAGISQARVQLDGHAQEAGFSVDWRGTKPRYGITLTSDAFNLDPYASLLPDELKQVTWLNKTADGEIALAPTDIFANVTLKVQTFTWQGTQMHGLDIDLKAHAGTLKINRFVIADYDGAAINVRGQIGQTLRRPDFALTGSFEAATPAPLFKLFGFDGHVLKNAGRTSVHFSGALDAQTGQVALEASFQQKTGGAVEMTGQVIREGGAFVLDAKSTGTDGSVLTLNGTSDETLSQYELSLKARAPDVPAFAAVYSVDYRVAGGKLGPLDLVANLTFDDQKFKLNTLIAHIGKAQLNLNGSLTLASAGPVFEAKALFTDVALDRLTPLKAPVVLSSGLRSVQDIKTLQNQILGTDGESMPAPAWAGQARGQIHVSANSISSGVFRFKDLTGDLTLKEGTWFVSDLSSDVFNGTLTGEFSYSAGELLPELSGEVSLKSVAWKAALSALLGIGQDAVPLSGPTDIDLSFDALGHSKPALLSSLNGKITVAAADGAFEGFDVLAFIKGIGEATSLETYRKMAADTMTSGRSAYQSLYGVLDIEDGKILAPARKNAADESLLAILSPRMITDTQGAATLTFDGMIDLTTRLINGEGRIRLMGAEKSPALNIRLTGPLKAPQRHIESAALGSFYIDQFAARADDLTGTETDRKIEVFRSAIDTLNAEN